MSSYRRWRRYVPVAERRRRAAKKIANMSRSGREVSPVEIAGRKIATTFWGNAWCRHLESFSDFSNRLPRGRTYVRNGSVVDLQIQAGRVRSLVSGSSLYEVEIRIARLPEGRWGDLKGRCAGEIGSLVELLRGSFSKGVMEIVTQRTGGLFPTPREIELSCSCPDWATMCKHVAATLYGVGARLDDRPELLFTLRNVDPTEMVEDAARSAPVTGGSRREATLADDELASVFGIDIDTGPGEAQRPAAPAKRGRSAKTGKAAKKKAVKRNAAAGTTSKRTKKSKKISSGRTTSKGTKAETTSVPSGSGNAAKKKTARKKTAKKKTAKKKTAKRGGPSA